VEFDTTANTVRDLLTSGQVDPAGKDFFGLSALHKFAGWDRVDLTELLLPALSASEINADGGSEGRTALHFCVEMGAWRTFAVISGYPRANAQQRDGHGRTPQELAALLGVAREFAAATGPGWTPLRPGDPGGQ